MSENTDTPNSSSKKLAFLVKWIGSFPESAYDVISADDVVIDEYNPSLASITVGRTISVYCDRRRSPAEVLQISDNFDALIEEKNRLQQRLLQETSTNQSNTSENTHHKKRKYGDENSVMKKFADKEVQTNGAVDEDTVSKLIHENRKLKAELYESNKMINSMCTAMKNIVLGTQKKMREQETDSTVDINDTDSSLNEASRKSSTISSQSSDSSRRSNDTSLSPPLDYPEVVTEHEVLIGTGRTPIPRSVYNQMNWFQHTAATRKLLMAVFSREILATHSLTGKPSPAFQGADMPVKMKLDPVKVADIVEIVSARCSVSESMVRGAITTKCADENKMHKKRLEKSKIESDK